MEDRFENDEIEIKSGPANIQRGLESVGGKLTLTNFRLYFIPHALNAQSQKDIIDLKSIDSTKLTSSKLLNIFPVFPNAISIIVKEGREYRFTVFRRAEWLKEIDQTRKAK